MTEVRKSNFFGLKRVVYISANTNIVLDEYISHAILNAFAFSKRIPNFCYNVSVRLNWIKLWKERNY